MDEYAFITYQYNIFQTRGELMELTDLYCILDIEEPKEFTFYENMAALLEEDRSIDPELLEELIASVEEETFAELLESYFDEFMRRIPDQYVDLYVTVETIKRAVTGAAGPAALAEAIDRFRRWYVIDLLVTDQTSGEELSVRDARYNIAALVFTDEICDYDFTRAYEYGADGYDVRFSRLIDAE